MSLIDDIERDREAGTEGPWRWDGDPIKGSALYGLAGEKVLDFAGYEGMWFSELKSRERAFANANRIARVPDMEAALLAANELAQAAINLFGIAQDEGIVGDRTTLPAMAAALAAYRKAVGAET